MAPSMTAMLCLLASRVDAVVALPKTSVGMGLGQVSNLQPDSLTELPADSDFQVVSLMGLQRHALVRKAITSDFLDADLHEGTVLGLQQSASLRRS